MKNKKKPVPVSKLRMGKVPAVAPKKSFRWHYVTIVLFAFLLYGNTIPNRYSMDDNYVTETNKQIVKGFRGLGEIFTTHYTEGTRFTYDYRPVVKATFAIEYQFFGANPHVSHFINVLLYALTGIFLFFLLRKLLKDLNPVYPFIVVLLYMAHPVHSEVVASLKNRDEMLSFLGSLATLYFCFNYVETNKLKNLLAAVFTYWFALLSKGNAMTYLAMIPVTLYFFTGTGWKKLAGLFAFLFILFVLYKYVPRLYLEHPVRQKNYYENPFMFEKDLWAKIATSIYILGVYLKLLIFPHPLLYYYGYKYIPILHFNNGWVILSLFLHIALLGYAFYKIREKHIVSFGILFYLITISMFSNFLRPVMGLVGERYLYAASLGFFIAAGYYLFRIFRVRLTDRAIPSGALAKILTFLVIVLIPYSAKTIVRNQDWKDRFTLYSHDIQYLGNSIKANNMLAAAIMEKVRKEQDVNKRKQLSEQALNYYLQANRLDSSYAITLNNIGSIYFTYYKDYEKAFEYFRKSYQRDSLYTELLFNIGNYYQKTNRPADAETYYLKAISADRNYHPPYASLSNLYLMTGQEQKLISLNEALMKADTVTEVPYLNMGNFYMSRGDTANAVTCFEKVVAHSIKYRKVCLNLAAYFHRHGNEEKADFYRLKAREAKKAEESQPK